jgi:hypothetical protein
LGGPIGPFIEQKNVCVAKWECKSTLKKRKEKTDFNQQAF